MVWLVGRRDDVESEDVGGQGSEGEDRSGRRM